MKGDFVVIRAFGGEAIVRRVWEDDGEVVQISDPLEYEKLLSGRDALMPVGFQRGDVYQYHPSLADVISSGVIKWNDLLRY